MGNGTKLPAGQTIEQNFETATIPPQFIQSRSSTEYNAIGQAIASTDANGLRSETTSSTQYDSSGRVVQTTDPYGRTSTTTYNAKGAVVQTRQQTYDSLRRFARGGSLGARHLLC